MHRRRVNQLVVQAAVRSRPRSPLWAGALLLLALGLLAAGRLPAAVAVEHRVDAAALAGLGVAAPVAREALAVGRDAWHRADYALARRWLRVAAEGGEAEAQYLLGMIYDAGHGLPAPDPVQAAAWYRRAARAGHAQAQHNLGAAYLAGDGVPRDVAAALRWWHRAAAGGSVDAQFNLGVIYALGRYGVRPDMKRAMHWWRRAAILGDPMAQYNLGTLYANGDGPVRSYCEAQRWWERSAAKGVSQAALALQILRSRPDYTGCW